ncbi:hypothetical protein TNIN_193351 [Trichonephila inaurata madagascariensis]|uniref:Uncharacterized protein n=1 Tax=Trichonephila inaurata madagascariensis TaxID=2747483 RepID=A0A8X6XSB7_9ARAC|nr:hypothetical protein TNIN_193351 [Trichonephila inaurata madagascariensis]
MEDNTSSEKKIKQYFTSDAWTALSEYEKRRYENVQRNYEFLKASGYGYMMFISNHSDYLDLFCAVNQKSVETS